jgi:predicted Rossmann-fold nucleotide-binding protein
MSDGAGEPRVPGDRGRSSTLHTLEELGRHLASSRSLRGFALQGLDLGCLSLDWSAIEVRDTLFLGCRFASDAEVASVRAGGGLLFPRLDGVPYDPWRSSLYTWQELLEGYALDDDHSLDHAIYRHFLERGRYNPDVREALAQRLHDHAIDDALRGHVGFAADGATRRPLVGIMGGHGVPRGVPEYRRAARIARLLARKGYLVASGGGPGVMEAANLGAWLSRRDEPELEAAIDHLAAHPDFRDHGYVARALEVLERHPEGPESLAIPTWFYGHEPSNVFATRIAKYFSNSLREDALLSLCLHGIVYARGSAGTTQEIFTDAAQNHYSTLDWISPMVFLGRERYIEETGIFPLVQRLARGRRYAELLLCSDDPLEVVSFLEQHPPLRSSNGE